MKKFEHYTLKRFKSLIKALKGFHQSNDPELLHRMRVEIKKIKTIQRMIGSVVRKFKPHSRYKPFRIIFRQAGLVREPLVTSQLIRHYHIEPDSAQKNHSGNETPVEKFVLIIPEFLKTIKQERKLILKHAPKVRKEDITRRLKRKLKVIRNKLYPVPDFSQIHSTRKIIKEALYLADALGNPDFPWWIPLKDIEEQAGLYHDKLVIITQLGGQAEKDRELLQAECALDESAISLKVNALYHKN